MMEALDPYQALEQSLDLQDRLVKCEDSLTIITVIAEAVRYIGRWERDHHLEELRAQLRVTDRLQDIRAQVTALYKEICIPRDYTRWWEAAQSELDERVQWYKEASFKLGVMPCSDARQRRRVRDTPFVDSRVASHLKVGQKEYEASINDPIAFAQWKEKMKGWLQGRIDACHRLKRRFVENAP